MIDEGSYKFFVSFLKERMGTALTDDKKYLLEARLEPLLDKYSLNGFQDLAFQLKHSSNKALMNEVCDMMTTNESLFFRDQTPFELLKKTLLPEMIKRNSQTKRIMIWSVAASTGQEAYSISMDIDETFLHYNDWQFKIIATDISDRALEIAKKGVYSDFEVKRGLSESHLRSFFSQENKEWQIKDRIKKRVEFRKLNLVEDFSHMEMFDIIFCRNVLIYFDLKTKQQVVAGLNKHLKSAGYFFLGAAESMMGISTDFEKADEQTAVYRKR